MKTKFKFVLFRFSKKSHPSLKDYYQCTTIGNYETEEMVSLSKLWNYETEEMVSVSKLWNYETEEMVSLSKLWNYVTEEMVSLSKLWNYETMKLWNRRNGKLIKNNYFFNTTQGEY